MEINHFISSKSTGNIGSLAVNLSAEYTKGSEPGIIVAAITGYDDEDTSRKYVNVTIKYETKSDDFRQINGGNVNMKYLTAVVPMIKEFFEQIKQDLTTVEVL